MTEVLQQRKTSRYGKYLVPVFALVLLLGGAWKYKQFQDFLGTPLSIPAQGYLLEVNPGLSLSKLAYELQKEGILSSPRYLVLRARLRDNAHVIQAGEYKLEAGLTPDTLLDLLVSGKVTRYSLTLVEGWTFRQFMNAVNSHGALLHTLEGKTDDSIMEAIGKAGIHPEGRFLPETYQFPKNSRDTELLQRAYSAMEIEVARNWEDRDPELPLKDAYQALILASIIEKETASPDEYQKISGVFIRRLRKGMLLQTDPTVIYGLGVGFDGNLRVRDLKSDTPYNTYTRRGLPPTPIAMPGKAAIAAAVHPDSGDALYFVSRGDGTHHFSKTLEEHNQAVARYQLRKGG